MTFSAVGEADPGFLSDLRRLVQGEHWDPHSLLGLHPFFGNEKVVRLWRPDATEIHLEIFGRIVNPKKIHEAGVFEFVAPEHTTAHDYKIYHQNGLLAHDPYSFSPTWGELDAHLFNQGVHYQLYEVLGGRECVHQGVRGVKFCVWAPAAMHVSVVGDFNFWDGRVNPMRSMGRSGVWEIFIPGLTCGERYKFEIKTQQGQIRIKSDPFAYASEIRPLTASVVGKVDAHSWKDQEWMEKRTKLKDTSQPLNIYEIHLGSWKWSHGHPLTYRELASELSAYCKEMGYTHVELLPPLEHPLDESWGYQVVGFFAVTSRFGTPEDFQYFVDHLHQNNIGVILDWVPGHFPTDDFSLSRFDGTALYEHEDPRQGMHPHWSTLIFNYGRHEVSNFLLASALFWIDKMHIDGLRVDAVASMLYLDYGRNEGEWIPNRYGGKENLEAIEFLKHLNSIIHQKFPGVITIAEESTAFPYLTHPVNEGGIGFDYKWNMGWMNDTLRYFQKDPLFRRFHHNDLTFGLLYAFSERFVLVLSHDEVVHGKRSLVSKMPGDDWQKFANLRLLLSYMMCQPGKKMLFMGGEIGQWNEWNCKEEAHWHLLQYDPHKGLHRMLKDLNHLYLHHDPLWHDDFSTRGFEWVDFSDIDNSVISYRRKGPSSSSQLLCVHHFTPNYLDRYFLRLPGVKSIKEIFNSDNQTYWGSGKLNSKPKILKDLTGESTGVEIVMAPLATMIFEIFY